MSTDRGWFFNFSPRTVFRQEGLGTRNDCTVDLSAGRLEKGKGKGKERMTVSFGKGKDWNRKA